jgi:hypothetical protein
MGLQYMRRNTVSRQKVNSDVKSWDRAIEQAQSLLTRAENRVARLKGAIETFRELRDRGHAFDGPASEDELVVLTQAENQTTESCHSV